MSDEKQTRKDAEATEANIPAEDTEFLRLANAEVFADEGITSGHPDEDAVVVFDGTSHRVIRGEQAEHIRKANAGEIDAPVTASVQREIAHARAEQRRAHQPAAAEGAAIGDGASGADGTSDPAARGATASGGASTAGRARGGKS